MDMYRAFLAVILSFLILIGYQYFFVPPRQAPAPVQTEQQETPKASQPSTEKAVAASPTAVASPSLGQTPVVAVDASARDIVVDTPLYRAVFFEQGGGLKSFVLKKYRTKLAHDSAPMELVKVSNPAELPLVFTLDNGVSQALPLFKSDTDHMELQGAEQKSITMTATLDGGVQIVRTIEFTGDSYLLGTTYQITNRGSASQQVSPALGMTQKPFEHASSTSRYLFSGPVAYIDGELHEIKSKKFKDGPQTLQGNISWAAYEDNYFMCVIIPDQANASLVTMSSVKEEVVRTVVGSGVTGIAPGEGKTYGYKAYLGPKKLSILKSTGYELSRAVNFGWFDVLAKPVLFLLNYFYSIIGNYGIAIIIVTCLIKAVFWPITQKGMKSMKNMQKLQPKVAKLKEKYKDDPAKMNQEMMAMYKTYKVNPIGGCLPMLIQIPFFFALYRVLMAAIELRHAPFMLWINDLSAPDRLMVGFDIPMLHGIPVLTLLMGASMYLQQKMTPTTADPTQAKIMQFLPVVFTFMFINFASGLVLYWFVNNLLSILQQQLINRQTSKA